MLGDLQQVIRLWVLGEMKHPLMVAHYLLSILDHEAQTRSFTPCPAQMVWALNWCCIPPPTAGGVGVRLVCLVLPGTFKLTSWYGKLVWLLGVVHNPKDTTP